MTDQPPLSPELDEIEADLELLVMLLRRYRSETPLGNQPHMIAHQADVALERWPTLLDTIRQLREQVREAKAALEPFAMHDRLGCFEGDDDLLPVGNEDGLSLTVADFRRARTVHSKLGE